MNVEVTGNWKNGWGVCCMNHPSGVKAGDEVYFPETDRYGNWISKHVL